MHTWVSAGAPRELGMETVLSDFSILIKSAADMGITFPPDFSILVKSAADMGIGLPNWAPRKLGMEILSVHFLSEAIATQQSSLQHGVKEVHKFHVLKTGSPLS